MANPIRPRRSFTASSVPQAADATVGELLINYVDKIIYTKNPSGQIISLPIGSSGGSMLVYSSTADFPAVGSSALYCAAFTSRLYRWDTTNAVYVEVGPVATQSSYTVPGAPTGVTATAGNAQATVSWTAPSASADAPVFDYVVQYSSNSGSTWTTVPGGTSATASAVVTGLTNGSSYTFRVAAVNGIGRGAWSSASSPVTLSAFTPMAVLLTSGTSYTVPANASTMKAWVVGAGGSQGSALGNAGAVAYKTWSVTPGSSVAYSLGANSTYGSRTNTTLTYDGTTISAQSGSGTDWSPTQAATYSGGDGGADGGLHGYPTGSGGSGGAVGGNSGPASCGRYTATDVSGLFAAVVLAGGSVTETCGATAAFGSGGTVNAALNAGIGGGGAFYYAGQESTAGGPSAVVLYFS